MMIAVRSGIDSSFGYPVAPLLARVSSLSLLGSSLELSLNLPGSFPTRSWSKEGGNVGRRQAGRSEKMIRRLLPSLLLENDVSILELVYELDDLFF